jgi:ABC-2 type transport system permease protein
MANNSPAVAAPRSGSIYDLGYRHYEGPRRGRLWAMWSLYAESLRGIWGLGRPATAKAVPLILAGLYLLPAAFQLAFSSLIAQQIQRGETSMSDLFSYANYFGGLSIFVLFFCIAQAPEVVCRDQRYSVLPLYFTRSLGRIEYATARLASLTTAIFIVLMLPNIALFIGDVLMKTDTFSALGTELPRSLPSIPASLLIAASLAAISLALSSFTPRRAYAAIGIVAYFLLMEAIPAAIYSIGEASNGGTGHGADQLFLVTPLTSLTGATAWFFDTSLRAQGFLGNLTADEYLAASLASVAIFAAILLFRYRRVSA